MILALLMGWQFTVAEFVGGPIMIVLMAVLFRLLLRRKLLNAALELADRGVAGSMEGHVALDTSVQRDGSPRQRLFSGEALTSVSHVFVMEWAVIWKDLVGGLLIAGAIGAWVPDAFWQGCSSPAIPPRRSRRRPVMRPVRTGAAPSGCRRPSRWPGPVPPPRRCRHRAVRPLL